MISVTLNLIMEKMKKALESAYRLLKLERYIR